MLLTKISTEKKENQVELKTPYFVKVKYGRAFMLCDDGSIMEVGDTLIAKWENRGLSDAHAERIGEILAGEEITESEFMAAYESAMSGFEKSMFPEAVTGKKY